MSKKGDSSVNKKTGSKGNRILLTKKEIEDLYDQTIKGSDQVKEQVEESHIDSTLINTVGNFNSSQGIYLAGHSYVISDGKFEDQLPRFIKDGIWENGSDDKNLDRVKSIAEGAIILSKTKSIVGSILIIDAIGIVSENIGDGNRLKVKWYDLAKDFGIRKRLEFPGIAGNYPGTIHPLKPEHIQDIVSALGPSVFKSFIGNEENNGNQYAVLQIRPDSKNVYLNAKIIAEEFGSIIHRSKHNTDSSKPSQEDRFYGIFGQWGRGKTRFWNLLKDYLKNHTGQYKFINFHAWKYQDTPAIWAYLYEKFADEYYLNTRYLILYPVKVLINGIQSMWLSVFRSPGLLYLFAISTGFLLVLLDKGENLILKGEYNWEAISIAFGPAAISIYSFLKTFSKPIASSAKQYNKLASRKSFKVHLGIQHEAQEELKTLLRAWYWWRPIGKKKTLVLFIDDIDRCDEKKVVQIVDSIRVMLNEPEIQKRLIVIAAIDERILCQAIRKKYESFVGQNKEALDIGKLTAEYLDKLFITGIKLSPLNDIDKKSVLEGYAKEITEEPNVTQGEGGKTILEEISADGESEDKDNSTEIDPPTNVKINKTDKHDKELQVSTYELTMEEKEMLSNSVQELKYATPRSIRGFLIKYRIARNLSNLILPMASGMNRNQEIANRVVEVMNFEHRKNNGNESQPNTHDSELADIVNMIDYYHYVESES